MKFKKLVLPVIAAVLLVISSTFCVLAAPGDDSSAPLGDTQPPATEPPQSQTEYIPEPTEPPYSEPQPDPDPVTQPAYTDPPVTSQTQPPASSEEETQSRGSWLDIFKLPTEPTNEQETIPEKKDKQTTTTQYVVMGILLWVLIACGTFVTLGVLASTHRRKRGK